MTRITEHDARVALEQRAQATRDLGCSSDFLRDCDDLAPARPHIWLIVIWALIIAALAMIFATRADAAQPVQRTPAIAGTPGTVPPSVSSSSTATVTANPSATAGAQAGASTGPVTAGNSLTLDARGASYAPDVIAYPTAPCRVAFGASGGGLSAVFGFSGSVEDENCTLRETSRQLWNVGQKEAAVQVLCLQADARLALEASGVACRAQRPATGQADRVTP